MTSIIFPGQGSQFLGMTKDFYNNYSIAKDTINEIEDATNMDLKKIIFGNDDNLLNITNFTQVSIFAASMSIYQTLEKSFGFENLKGYDTQRLYAYLAERYLSFWFNKYTRTKTWPWTLIDINKN